MCVLSFSHSFVHSYLLFSTAHSVLSVVIHELINVSNISWFLETKHRKKTMKPNHNSMVMDPERGEIVYLFVRRMDLWFGFQKKRKNPKIDVIIQFHLVTPVVCVWLIGRPLFCRCSAAEHGWGYFLIFLLPFCRILFIICVTWLIRVYFQIVGCWLLLVFGPISPTCST